VPLILIQFVIVDEFTADNGFLKLHSSELGVPNRPLGELGRGLVKAQSASSSA
jgi:hypothetical protein